MNTTVQAKTAPPTLVSTVARLAGVIGAPHYPVADRAVLRRWAPGQPVPLAFYRLWLRHIGDDLPAETALQSWVLLAWSLATMGTGAHRAGHPLGQALAESKFSEARLERLLAAPDEVRADVFMNAVRFLAAKDAGFDHVDAARYLLATDPAARERIHRAIAQAFYRNLRKHEE